MADLIWGALALVSGAASLVGGRLYLAGRYRRLRGLV